jgi:hypothetical protein
MDLNLIKSVSFSLMKKETDMGESTAEYTKKLTAKIILPPEFPKNEETFESLVKDMYKDLMTNAPDDADSLGVFIEYDNTILDNAITLRTLNDIQEYSNKDVNPIWEFFKMTFIE